MNVGDCINPQLSAKIFVMCCIIGAVCFNEGVAISDNNTFNYIRHKLLVWIYYLQKGKYVTVIFDADCRTNL